MSRRTAWMTSCKAGMAAQGIQSLHHCPSTSAGGPQGQTATGQTEHRAVLSAYVVLAKRASLRGEVERMATLAPKLIEFLLAFLIAYGVALWASLIVWTFRDIQSRTNDLLVQTLSTMLVVVFNLLGLLIYFILRPHETAAESYQRSLEEETLLQNIEQ